MARISPCIILTALVVFTSLALSASFTNHAFRQQSLASSLPCKMNFLDEVGKLMKRFTMKANASHILIKGGAEAEIKLEDIKAQIDNDPVAFAEAAAQYSECPSARQGGNLGEFGPGQMVKEFDTVVFNDDVGVVHGPIKTQFGYHLIYINDRTE
jgi:peptidyl-prolyl cis-trans isomerase C